MKKLTFAIISFWFIGCNYKVDKSFEDIPISAQFVGELNCPKNYKVFRVSDPTVIQLEKLTPLDTITLDGVKYSNVFFADISEEIIRKSRFEKMNLFDNFLVYGFSPLQRNSIECDKYKNYLVRLRIKSIN